MAKRKIYLGPLDGGAEGRVLKVEGTAADAFLPGTLVERTGTTLATSNNAATVFNSECLIAREVPESEGGTIETAVTVGDTAEAIVLRSGEFANVRVATGQTVVLGSPLASNGAGLLRIAAVDGSEQILFYANEVITTTDTTLVEVRKA